MSRKVIVKRTKDKSSIKYDVSFSGLSIGELASIKNSLESHAQNGSAVAGDVFIYLKNGIKESSDDWIKDLG